MSVKQYSLDKWLREQTDKEIKRWILYHFGQLFGNWFSMLRIVCRIKFVKIKWFMIQIISCLPKYWLKRKIFISPKWHFERTCSQTDYNVTFFFVYLQKYLNCYLHGIYNIWSW